jgi:hypothetical protein
MTHKAQKKTSLVNGQIKVSNELLGLVVGIITSITFILTKIRAIQLDDLQLLLSVDILNIVVLAIALIAIKSTVLNINSKEFHKFIKHLNLATEEEGHRILTRVNELINQLVYSIRWFIIILGTFYLLQLFVDTTQEPYENLKHTISSNFSILQLLGNGIKNGVTSSGYLTLEILTNATNLFSASYLFLAFQVLFLVTIDDDNKTWRLKSYIPISIAFFIMLCNIVFFIIGFFGAYLSSISHIIRLIGGIYNGIAMLLLFSRFISMEYFFQNSRKNWQRNFYFYGTIIILPLYVVAQPLYGLFNAVEVGQGASLFKSIVFLICFWGKLVFLLFVYTVLSKKWIHAYLFMVLSQKDTLTKISIDLNEVDDL